MSLDSREQILCEALGAWRRQGLITAEQHGTLSAELSSLAASAPTAPRPRALATERKLWRAPRFKGLAWVLPDALWRKGDA